MTLLTDAEAKEKFCPLKWAAENVGVGCEGSACMAWRWGGAMGAAFEVPKDSERRGYCGSFGRVAP